MAHYVATVSTPRSPIEAFSYVSDLRNFEAWDPGVSSSHLVSGGEPGLGAEYDVKANGAKLKYVTKEYVAHTMTYVVAKTKFFESLDRISVKENGSGSLVTYDATLKLNGPLSVFDPLLALFFNRIGDKAGDGLATALNGERTDGGSK